MNWNGKKTLIAFGAASMLTLSLAGGAVAAGGKAGFGGFGGPGGPGGPRGALSFAMLDADDNGMLTVEDVAAGAAKRMAEADADGNGVLDQSEIAAEITARIEARGLDAKTEGGVRWMPELDADRIAWMAEGMILRADTDKSGTLSLEELTPKGDRISRMIARFDTDGDNALSESEFDAVQAKMAERGGPDGHRGGQNDRHGDGPRGGGQHRGGN